MGQKVNPHGLRVGVIKNWDSRWFTSDKKFGDTLVSDYNIRKYLKKALQDAGNFSKLLALQEEYKLMPLGDVWAEFCRRNNVCPCNNWYKEIEKYEEEVLSKRA